MIRSVMDALKRIPAAWQVFMVMVALMGIGTKLSGYVGLPSKVEQNTIMIHDLQDEHAADRNLLLRVLCNQNPQETFASCEQKYSGVDRAPRHPSR